MNVLICGDRNWSDRDTIRAWIAELRDWGYDTVIEGEARGADRIAGEEAEAAGMNVLRFPADWPKYGRAAGHIRNMEMLVQGEPQLVVAFHSDLSKSKGTANMIQQAEKAGIDVILVSM